MRQLVAVLCLLVGACASTDRHLSEDSSSSPAAWRGVAIAATALDIGATLAGTHAGAQEQNPVLDQRPARLIAVNAAILGAVWWFSRDLPPEQQARVWQWIAICHVGAFLWNLNELRGVRREASH